MTTLRIAWLFTRRSAGDQSTVLLPVVAFAVATALLLIVLGGAQAFFTWTDQGDILYPILAIIALVLLVVPLIGLGGAAARLSARRRDDRLAGLCLLGATSGLVIALTVIESTAVAAAGALLGVVLAVAAGPLIGLIPFRGEPLGSAALLEPGWIAAAACGVVAIAAVSAAIGLRRVVVSPLGIRTRQQAPTLHWLRLVALVAVLLIVYFGVVSFLRRTEGQIALMALVIGLVLGATMGVLNLAGPWVVRLLAAIQVRCARSPRRLLAARSILESPKAAWRQVSGVAMVSFTAVFCGVGTTVVGSGNGAADLVARQLMTDIRTGIIITIVASFLMVACSVGVSQAAAILDRRDLYVSLDRAGMSMEEMDAARCLAVLSPLRLTAVGSALAAAVPIFPIVGLGLLLNPLTFLVLAGCLAAGVLLVWLALRATRPVLRRVLADPAPSL